MSGAMGVAAHGNRGQQFTVGNISNGLIYLRYYLHSYILLPCNRLRERPSFLRITWTHRDGLSIGEDLNGMILGNISSC